MKATPEVIVITENPSLRDLVRDCFGEHSETYLYGTPEYDLNEIAELNPQVLIVDTGIYIKDRRINKEHINCKLLILIGQAQESPTRGGFDILIRSAFDLLVLKDLVLKCAIPPKDRDEDSLKAYLFDLLKRLSRALEEAYQKQALLDSVLGCISSGVLVTDLSGRVVLANPVARNILSQLSGTIQGCHLSEIIGKQRAERILNPRRDRPHHYRNEMVLNLPDGRTLVLGYTTTDRRDPSGRLIGKVISFRDLTELKQLQYEVEKLNRFSVVAEITSAVAHEIRNPLAGIRAMAQAIDEALPENDPQRQYTQRILKQVDRLNDILRAFFNYARPPAPEVRPVRLSEVINDIEPLVANSMNKKAIRFIKRIPPDLPRVLFDPTQLQQVLLNFILNSIDAVEEGRGVIELRAEEVKDFPRMADKKTVRIDIKDNGAGIPEHLQERVFMPFFTTKPWGTGLGLSVVKRIVEENAGLVEFSSAPGRGTVFTVYIRAEDASKTTHNLSGGGRR